jgi:hypothetical protein
MQPTAEDVEVHATSNMANVRLSLHRRATEIDTDLPRSDGREGRCTAREGVVESERHG